VRYYWTAPGGWWPYRLICTRDGWTVRELDIGYFPSRSQALCYVRTHIAQPRCWAEHQEPE
jgi:hypothetical protein